MSGISREQCCAFSETVAFTCCPLYAKQCEIEEKVSASSRSDAAWLGCKRGTSFGADCLVCTTCLCIPFRCLESIFSVCTRAICCGLDPLPARQPFSSKANLVCVPFGACCGGICVAAKDVYTFSEAEKTQYLITSQSPTSPQRDL